MDSKPKPIQPARLYPKTQTDSTDHTKMSLDEDKKVKLEEKDQDLQCMWTECHKQFNNSSSLVRHANAEHLNIHINAPPGSAVGSGTAGSAIPADGSLPIKVACFWEGCPRFGVDQPSRFALISHCRTHTGEKPYFCPIPECEKHFTRSDALAKHVKGVHDLHVIKDAVALIKEKAKKARLESNFTNQDNITEIEHLHQIEEDYDIKVPWWFSNDFLNIISESGDNSIYKIPLQPSEYKIAKKRYQSYYFDDSTKRIDESLKPLTSTLHPENFGPSVDSIQDLDQLKQIHESLSNKLFTASKVNKIATKQLETLVQKKRKLWLINQLLLDGNASLSIPGKSESGINQPDHYDAELYDSFKAV